MDMRRLGSLAALIIAAASLAACAGQDIDEGEGQAEDIAQVDSALLGDCSTDLGNCYIGCQNTPPTPTPECFTSCERVFRGCIGLEEVSQQ
jgi:hypothetical protein